MSDAVAVQLIISGAGVISGIVSVITVVVSGRTTRRKIQKVQNTMDALNRALSVPPVSRPSAPAPSYGDHLPRPGEQPGDHPVTPLPSEKRKT